MTYDTLLHDIILTAVAAAVPLLVVYITQCLSAGAHLLEARMSHTLATRDAESVKHLLDLVNRLTIEAVTAAAQVIVDDAKAAGKFDKAAAVKVKTDVINTVLSKLGPANQALADELHMDLPLLISDALEYAVHYLPRKSAVQTPAAPTGGN